MHPERQVNGHHAAQVRAQAVTDARQLVDVEAGRPETRQHVAHTPGHGFHVVHGRRVTRDRRQPAPVDHEHIVLSVVQVRCEQNVRTFYEFFFSEL